MLFSSFFPSLICHFNHSLKTLEPLYYLRILNWLQPIFLERPFCFMELLYLIKELNF